MRSIKTLHKYLAYTLFIGLFAITACDNPMSTNDVGSNDTQLSQSSVDLSDLADGEAIPGQYIVLFKDGTTNASERAQEVAQGRGVNGQVKQVFDGAVQGFTLQLPPQASPRAAEALLRNNPHVKHFEQDRVIKLDPRSPRNNQSINSNIVRTEMRSRVNRTTPIVDYSTTLWGLDRIDQRYLPLDENYNYDITGSGITVYVIDSGINFDHIDFEGRASFGFDAYRADGTDCNGHGTHVSGIIGGKTSGVAKEVNLVSIRVLDCNGNGTISNIISGINWINNNNDGPAIVNMSLGSGVSSTLDSAVKNSIENGLTYVTSAGNRAEDACNFSPARVPEIITVGSTTNDDSRSSFSNYGSCIDIFAPGSNITSTWIGGSDSVNILSGTSMASPHVAGTAALLLQKYPNASPAEIFSKIKANSTKGIVANSQSENNHLLFSIDQVYDGSGNDSLSGHDSDSDNDYEGTSAHSYPEINSFEVQTRSQGPWNRADVSWTVSSEDGNLDSVTLELLNGSSVVAESSTSVNGSSASGSDELRDRSTITAVKITVNDKNGNSTTETKSF